MSQEVDWKPDEYQPLEFEDGSELVSFFDSHINSGEVTLHPWQIEVNEELARAKPTAKHPHRFCLCAANGSGKDLFVIAPFSIWFILTKVEALVVITSASGVQLTNQTESYIRALANKVNAFYKATYGQDVIKINQRYFKCLLTGSEIKMFATDEEGRAEGYHPIRPNAEMAIIVNEAKSVGPEIFRALRRCTGYNYWLNVSTPGLIPAGDFYRSWLNWPNKRRVTKYDCPHHSDDDFEQDKRELGEHSALFRSKWLALFTTVDGDTIIPSGAIEKLKDKIRGQRMYHMCTHWPVRVGIDLAAGGDEVVVTYFVGNRQLGMWHWREKDTTKTVDEIDRILRYEIKVKQDHPYIFADDGGIGRAMIDMLKRMGWINIRRILNQSQAKNKKMYRNRGAEIWYNFRRLVEEGIIWLIDDETLWSQISTRRYKKISEGSAVDKVQLESKLAAKAEGLPSPDRADATVLALCGVTYNSFYDAEIQKDEEKTALKKFKMSADNIQKAVDDMVFSGEFPKDPRKNKKPAGSLKVLMKQSYGNDYYRSDVARSTSGRTRRVF